MLGNGNGQLPDGHASEWLDAAHEHEAALALGEAPALLLRYNLRAQIVTDGSAPDSTGTPGSVPHSIHEPSDTRTLE